MTCVGHAAIEHAASVASLPVSSRPRRYYRGRKGRVGRWRKANVVYAYSCIQTCYYRGDASDHGAPQKKNARQTRHDDTLLLLLHPAARRKHCASWLRALHRPGRQIQRLRGVGRWHSAATPSEGRRRGGRAPPAAECARASAAEDDRWWGQTAAPQAAGVYTLPRRAMRPSRRLSSAGAAAPTKTLPGRRPRGGKPVSPIRGLGCGLRCTATAVRLRARPRAGPAPEAGRLGDEGQDGVQGGLGGAQLGHRGLLVLATGRQSGVQGGRVSAAFQAA